MVVTIDFEVILVTDECEVSSKCHYEVLDIVDNLFFYDLFIYVGCIALSNFFNVDEVKKVLIFEHHDGFASCYRVRDCIYEVVWKAGVVMKGILFN